MWLEEFAWLWLPLVCGAGLWGLWNIATLKAEVRMLRERLKQLEDEKAMQSQDQWRVA